MLSICRRIQYLLRLAELCDPSESDRKRRYMDCIDELMDSYIPEEDEVIKFFDFNAPESKWKLIRVSDLYDKNVDLFFGYTASSLGKELTDLAKENNSIKRSRRKAGIYYFLPPLKER